MSTINAWYSFADKVLRKARDVFDESEIDPASETSGPKVWALTLLMRTVSNLEAAILMMRNGYVVEARTMARCCYENLFWAASLARTGKEFLALVELDNAARESKPPD